MFFRAFSFKPNFFSSLAQLCVDWRNLNPQWKYLPESDLKRSIKILDTFCYDIIKKRRQEIATKNDLLSLYLAQDPNVSDEELRDTMLNFLIAGRVKAELF